MTDRKPHGSFLEARHDFRQRRQVVEDEIMAEYLTAIRILAVDCNFGETLVERLMEQLVNGCAEKIQQELLAMDGLTLRRVFAIKRSHDSEGREATQGIS